MASLTITKEADDKAKAKRKSAIKRSAFAFIAIISAILLIAAIIVYEVHSKKNGDDKLMNFYKSESKLGRYKNGAVVGGGAECSGVGTAILEEGGHAVDAGIAAMLCLSVAIPYSLGMAGGHFSVIYDRKSKTIDTVNARETAPLASSRDMYQEEPWKSKYGGMSSGVPGEIKGYWEAHQKYGRVPWKRLFDGAIDKATNGIKVHDHYLFAMKSMIKHADDNSSAIHLVKNSETNEYVKLGDVVKQLKVAETLKAIAEGGYEEFYGGKTGQNFVNDVKKYGGILTIEDLKNYKVVWKKPLSVKFKNDLKMYSLPPPSSGAVAALILNIMDGYNHTLDDRTHVKSYAEMEHKLVEAFKFAYANRARLGDMDYVDMTQVVEEMISKEFADKLRSRLTSDRTHEPAYYSPDYENQDDHGTGHVSVVDKEGNAVAITSTLNGFFGSKNVSDSTGILIGNTMDDFSTPNRSNQYQLPPSVPNFIEPGKRPQSSMVPSLFIDEKGDVQLAIGAAGGTKITSAVALVAFRALWLKINLKEAIDEPRLHHQLIPNRIYYEGPYPEVVLKILRAKGHATYNLKKHSAVIQAISRNQDGYLLANSDYRKGGFENGY